MEHCIHVFIAKKEFFQSCPISFPNARIKDLPQGFAMIPLTEEFYDDIPETEGQQIIAGAEHFELLGPKIHSLGLTLSKSGPIAYCETDYSEEAGTERALVWDRQKITSPPCSATIADPLSRDKSTNAPINTALRIIGVTRSDTADEFETLQLGKYGNDLDWVEQI